MDAAEISPGTQVPTSYWRDQRGVGAREAPDQPLVYEEQFEDSQPMAAVLAGDVRLSSLFIHLALFQISNL